MRVLLCFVVVELLINQGRCPGDSRSGGEWAAMNVTVWLVALHMGALHPYEKVLTLVLAFGPFLLLAGVIVARRRHDAAEEAGRSGEPDSVQRDK
jgi:hypothetical protein